MKHNITIKDLIYFGAISEAYKTETLKLEWSWQFGCGCAGNSNAPTHKYDDCAHQDNLFWSDRFTEVGRTIKMPLQQDEVEYVICRLIVREDDADKLRAIIEDAKELLGDLGMEYHDILVAKLKLQESSNVSLLEEHEFYSRAKIWYLSNNMTPLLYEEVKVNVVAKLMSEKLLQQLEKKEEATVEAIWTPNQTEPEELLFKEHTVNISEGGHVTSEDETIKAEAS